MNVLVFNTMFALVLVLVSSVAESSFICDETHNRFKCKDGNGCVTLNEKCDFKNDCRDRSDEDDCVHHACNSTYFTCKNGKCIHRTWTCDGKNDCFDDSDEDSELCSATACSSEEFSCRGSTECLPRTFKCDGDEDCPDGEDERDCVCDANTQTQCTSGECIDVDFKCDGEEDCRDGSDEMNCKNAVCNENEFSCASGDQCIQETWKCDGMTECVDGSDEENCEEENSKCPDHYFQCKSNGQCIPMSWKCDGNAECPDKSDELECDNRKSECPHGQRLCANQRQCVDKRKFCDGNRDCIDKSDEHQCPERPTTDCPVETHFKCPGTNGRCIRATQLCDNFEDCPGKEDEKTGPHFCGFDECAESSGNCSHTCINRRLGYECACRDGFKLMEDGRSCEDINECKNTNSSMNPCDHHCFNTEGSYKCSCWEGFQLIGGRTCKATTLENEVTLLVADRNKIENITLHRERSFHILLKNIYVKSIAVNVQKDFVYWADVRNEKISRASLSNPKETKVIHDKPVVRSPHRIAIDWVHGLLFWVDLAYETVSVSQLDGTNAKTLLTTDSPAISIAVHPTVGQIFLGYTSRGSSGKIERCGMDGEKCVDIATQLISYPIDIAIDYEENLLYWIDGVLNLLVVSDLDGKNRKDTIIETHKPLSLAVYSGRVYFTDALNRQLVSTNRGGSDMRIIKEKLSSETDIVVLNRQEQREAEDHCAEMSCKWLCVPKSGALEHACLCPDHYILRQVGNGTMDCLPTTTTSSPTTKKTTSATETRTTSTTDRNEVVDNSTGDTPAASEASSSTVVILIFVVIFLIGLIVAILWLVMRWKRKRNARMSMNFNNPIYKKVNESSASNLSYRGLNTEPSPSTSAGDVSNGETQEPGASLILNEEIPDGSDPDLVPGLRFTVEGKYAKVPNGDTEIEFHRNNRNIR